MSARWCARRDSNAGPFAPEANALSRLSYGRKFNEDTAIASIANNRADT
jgi:hypothetical protein